MKYNLSYMFKTNPLWIYSLILFVWAVVTAVMIGLVFKLELHKIEAAFNQKVEQLYESIEHIARDNEAILEGFSAFLGAIEYADRESASRYARQILAHYPHVHRLEVVLFVKHSDLSKFIARQRQTWFPEFRIKALPNETDLALQPLKHKSLYLPIIFIEPLLPGNQKLIGADLDSLPILHDAINQSKHSQSSTSTLPFELVDGPRGYVLFRPVPNLPKRSLSKQKQALVLLEVNTDAIRQGIAPMVKNLDFSLYNANYSSEKQESLMFHIKAPEPDRMAAKLLPRLTAVRNLDRHSQPIAIKVGMQPGWSDLDVSLVISSASTSLLSIVFLLLFMASHFRWEEQRKRSEDRLLHMATHDALTGLPNRTLLADRFEQACSRMQRSDTSFSTLFIDLNGFKKVNDTHGHKVGDRLLVVLGGLLKECIREVDTLSRISGDEFVLLLEDATYDNAEKVAQKIQKALTRPVLVYDIELIISLSIGIAVYPEDGTTMSELLNKADQRMYQSKEQSRIVMSGSFKRKN